MPTVSVITPAFNAAAYLPASVESVLRQTFDDLELLIVDDGSSDDTVAVARRLAARDRRIRVVTQRNAGPGPARNNGFSHARGRYLAFVDSDDEWDSTFLTEQVAILDGRPDVDVLIGNARNRGGDRNGQPTRPVLGAIGERISLGDMLADESALFIMTVFRREVIAKVGGFDPALLTNEEYDLWIRAAIAGCSFARNPTPLGWYTCRPGSLSSEDARMHTGILRVLAKTRPLLAPGSKELAILDRKTANFETELVAIEARRALRARDYRTAADRLSELAVRRPGLSNRAAAMLVAAAPPVGGAAYRLSHWIKTIYRRSRGHVHLATAAVHRLRRLARSAAATMDASLRAWTGRRQVLVYIRNAMHAGVLEPVVHALEHDPRVTVSFLAETEYKRQHIDRVTGRRRRWVTASWARWARIDLLITADPWDTPRLERGYRRMNFFHGVGGKYNLDDPRYLPIEFHQWDRVCFVNADRMQRYLAGNILRPGAAVLVGYPKLDALVNGLIDAASVRDRLGLQLDRRTALYAPTWSPASSLNIAGDAIIGSLVNAGFNVIIKPHDLSFDKDPKYSGGIDWRGRLRGLERAGQVILADDPDASPLMAASDVLVTDHSSIGFEFCLLDRPIVVVHAPDLARVARINPERIALLRSAADVVTDSHDAGGCARRALDQPRRHQAERAAITRTLFHEPGTATGRAVGVAYDLLELSPYQVLRTAVPLGASLS
jgi:glycosyltransferase involved in cell wall biosynthesis